MNKQGVSFRLTPEAVLALKQLAKSLGISQAAVIELALRKLIREGIGESVIQVPPLSQQDTDTGT